MYKYLLSALVAFVFMFSSCTDSTEPSASPSIRPSVSDNAMETGKEDWEVEIYISCYDETVLLTGTLHYAKKDGVAHFSVSGVSGEGSNGNTYHGSGFLNENYFSDGAEHLIYSTQIVMTAAGGYHFRTTFKTLYHWDANGNLVVDKFIDEIDCNTGTEE